MAEAITLLAPLAVSKFSKLSAAEDLAVGVEKNLPTFEKEIEKALGGSELSVLKLLGESKIKNIAGLTEIENTVVYTEGKS